MYNITFNLTPSCLVFLTNTTVGIKVFEENRVYNIGTGDQLSNDFNSFFISFIGHLTCYEEELNFIKNFGLDIIEIKQV